MSGQHNHSAHQRGVGSGQAHAHGHAHGHGHGHGHHHPAPRPGAGLRLALAVTFGYALVELLAGLRFDSLALVSDAGHMFTDAVALGLAALASWLARRPAGDRHTFGLARAEVIAAFVNGLAMLLVVVLISVEAVGRLLDPRPMQGLGVMVVAFLGLLINLLVVFFLSRAEHNLNTRAAQLHVLADLAGSVAALAAGAIYHFTGWMPIDPILSLLIGLLILGSTLGLLRESLHVLMQGVPADLALPEVARSMAGIAGVRNVHDLHVWELSARRVALCAHVELDRLEDWPQVLSDARRRLKRNFNIDHITLQPETDGMNGIPARSVVRVFSKR